MRPFGIALCAALVVAVMAPATVMSASKKPPAVSEAARKQGMAEAPAAAQAQGLNCQVTDARFVAKQEDRKAKSSTTFYEIDCATGPGFVVIAATGAGKSMVMTCVEANTPTDGKPPNLPCILPGNADPKADLAPLLTKAGIQCTPTAARGIGQSPTNSFLEVSCQEGAGYVLVTSAPLDVTKPVEAQNCLNYDEAQTNVKCTLGDRTARLAVIDRYVAESKNNCVIKERRYVGATKDNANYFETSCNDGKGYLYKIDAKGALSQTWDCAKALGILGGCVLTDAREAATEQAGLYTKLAKAAGTPCEVDRYAIFPAPAGKDIVELVCKDGSGGVAIFEASAKGVVYGCGHALVAGYRCGLNKQDTGYAALTADLRKFAKQDCTVSESRLVSKTTKGTILLEVACTDGLKGYMIEYSEKPVAAIAVTNCAFIAGCKLKGNT